MTETRKQIIEFIEPYMEKDVKRGCILLMQNGDFINVDGYWEYEGPGDYIDDMYILASDVIEGYKADNVVEKILGHYDITAVLKYIGNHNGNFQQTYRDDFIWMTGQELELSKSDINIPNKPLHLYTEEEEKYLLELLKKLGPKT